MKTKICRSDFTFLPEGFGAYNVTYRSPKTGKEWKKRITDMCLIDETKNSDESTRASLERLRRICKF